MSFNRIYNYLESIIGLDVQSIGTKNIDNAINSLLMDSNISDKEVLAIELERSDQYRKELFERIIVPETWFFRDKKPFEYLKIWINKNYKLFGDDKIRLLSMPCSTGEEPYSIAISLMETGLSPNKFSIDAIDISEESIKKAREGLYSRVSFRNDDIDLSAYFDKIDDNTLSIKEYIRDLVNFRQDNILSLRTIEAMNKYHVVFFRNLLIYLNNNARERALNKIRILLHKDGILFTGHSETSFFLQNGFSIVKYPHAFALTLKPEQAEAKTTYRPNTDRGVANQKLKKSKEDNIRKIRKISNPLPKEIKQIPDIDTIKEYADKGEFDKALISCNEYLDNNKTDPNGYFILGLIQEAINNKNEAIEAYNKSLYLKPDLTDSLAHLSLLYSNIGQEKNAQLLKDRLKRIELKQNERN